jgi:hypothetical protein
MLPLLLLLGVEWLSGFEKGGDDISESEFGGMKDGEDMVRDQLFDGNFSEDTGTEKPED